MTAIGVGDAPGRYHLITMRSNDQFNTTIYGYSDRCAASKDRAMVLLINPGRHRTRAELEGRPDGVLLSDAEDGVHQRGRAGLKVTPYGYLTAASLPITPR